MLLFNLILVSPIQVYLSNVSFNSDPIATFLYLLILFVIVFVLNLFFGYLLGKRLQYYLGALFFSVSIYLCFAPIVFSLQNIKNKFFENLSETNTYNNSTIEIIAIVIILTLLFYVYIKSKINIYKLITFIFILQFSIISYQILLGSNNSLFYHSGPTLLNKDSLFKFSKNNHNTLLIIVDSLTGEVVEDILKNDKKLAHEFGGFTSFVDSISMYNSTNLALPGLLSGSYLAVNETPEEYYLRSFKSSNSIFSFSASNNVDFSFRSFISLYVFGDKNFDFMRGIIYLFKNGITSDVIIRSNLFFASSSRVLPNSLRNHYLSYLKSTGAISPIHRESDDGFIEDFRSNISAENHRSTLHIFHVMGAHRPYLDQDQKILSNSYDNYLTHSGSSVANLAIILDLLRKNHVYDNSNILIVGDHGVPNTIKQNSIAPHLMPVFMVKPINSSAPFHKSTSQVSLVAARSLLDISIKDPSAFPEAINKIKSDAFINKRVAYIFNSLDFNKSFKNHDLELNQFTVNGSAFIPDNWKYTGIIQRGIFNNILNENPNPNVYYPASQFNRGAGNKGIALIGSWGLNEFNGVWSIGKNASIIIPTENIPSGPILLKLNREVNANNKTPAVVSYGVNGKKLKTMILTGGNDVDYLYIPDSFRLSSNNLIMDLHISDTNITIGGEEISNRSTYFLKGVTALSLPKFLTNTANFFTIHNLSTQASEGDWYAPNEKGQWAGDRASLFFDLEEKHVNRDLALLLKAEVAEGRGPISIAFKVNGRPLSNILVNPNQKLPSELVIPASFMGGKSNLKVEFECTPGNRDNNLEKGAQFNRCLYLQELLIRTPKKYKVGDKILFSQQADGFSGLLGDWYAPEALRVWAKGKSSTVFIPLSDPWVGSAKLTLEGELGTAFSPISTITINGHGFNRESVAGNNGDLRSVVIPYGVANAASYFAIELDCPILGQPPQKEQRCVFLKSISLQLD